MSEMDLDALRDELAEFAEPKPEASRSAVEERVLAGFEEIQRWVAAHGRLPRNDEGLDIFERLYAVRLERLRAQPNLRAVLEPIDQDGILAATGRFGVDPSALT